MGPGDLDLALKSLPRQSVPEVLVGYENADDAGVYTIAPGVTLVQTVDYFAPIVDDPQTYGQIAAANALSDIYAMGGTPKTALAIVGFPTEGVPVEILGEIMRGGLEKLNEAGVALLGGHSVRDDEIKFGYAVAGVIEAGNIKENKNARPGDRIFLTKALGTGLITTALKKGQADPDHVRAATEAMLELNRKTAEIALHFEIDTMTDISGFGLAGHALEVARASNVAVSIDHKRLAILPGALAYSRAGFCAGGLNSNREFYSNKVKISSAVPEEYGDVVFDPQTSGGLLIFCRPEDANALKNALVAGGVRVEEVGSVKESGPAGVEII